MFLDCMHDSSCLLTQQGNAWIWGSTKVHKRVDMRHYEVCYVGVPIKLRVQIADEHETLNGKAVFTEDVKIGRWHGLSIEMLLTLFTSQHIRLGSNRRPESDGTCHLNMLNRDLLMFIVRILNDMLAHDNSTHCFK